MPYMIDMIQTGINLTDQMYGHGKTTDDVAQAAQMSRRRVDRWMAGKYLPSLEEAAITAKYLGCLLDDLIAVEEME